MNKTLLAAALIALALTACSKKEETPAVEAAPAAAAPAPAPEAAPAAPAPEAASAPAAAPAETAPAK